MNPYGSSMSGSAVRPTSPKSVIRFVSSENSLQHYGIPGQKWGVITKEYEPVTVDHRLSNKASQQPKQYKSRAIRARKTRADYREEARVIRERNERVRKRALAIGAAAVGLVAAYGAIRYVRIQKAKAYSGLLNRFIKQNPSANLASESGRMLLKNGVAKASANSKTLANARNTNKYLKRIGKTVDTKEALKAYKARRSISRLANTPVNPTGNKVVELMRKFDRRRLFRLVMSRYRI